MVSSKDKFLFALGNHLVGLWVNVAYSRGCLPITNVGADRLARRGLQHPPCCPLCDQEGETINHLLVASVFSWQFWFALLQRVGLQNLSPQQSSFDGWCSRINKGVVEQVCGVNSIVILGSWTIWNQCSVCVFMG